MSKEVLVTGGAGFIGSHTVIQLTQAGYTPIIVDNFSNSSPVCLTRLEEITGQKIKYYEADILDTPALSEIFKKHDFQFVIHFAALKAVGESVSVPLKYYKVNVGGTVNLVEVMSQYGCKNLIFSSSATVYGAPQYLPLDEVHPTGVGITNPYGQTKHVNECVLRDLAKSDSEWNIVLLRYFNPVGAHKSGMIGEDPKDIPNNLMPYVSQTAIGRRECLSVFGSDYDTPDGTGVRDYIHVVDLAEGHVKALNKLEESCGLKVYNLGTGNGYSVLDIVNAFSKASGKEVPYKLVGRRAGDVASCYSDPALAKTELNWVAERGLDEMCEDAWHWQSKNPNGFETPPPGKL
ncbi:UDP-glucose 4-epimerase-like isoform X3 [Bolinopsis microptera]|uniref:UDP-glucose 4-epimerase-like isoform X3 n=1 Tax=Bolinopsis microptera TaxID=2820187 RepID=UPI003078C3D5